MVSLTLLRICLSFHSAITLFSHRRDQLFIRVQNSQVQHLVRVNIWCAGYSVLSYLWHLYLNPVTCGALGTDLVTMAVIYLYIMSFFVSELNEQHLCKKWMM